MAKGKRKRGANESATPPNHTDERYFSWLTEKDIVRAEVVNQKHCNCCTAISVAHATESAFAIFKKEPLQKLSVQHLIDCTHTKEQVKALMKKHGTTKDSKKCYETPVEEIYKHMQEKGAVLEDDYPIFEAERKKCRVGAGERNVKKIIDHTHIEWDDLSNDEIIIKAIRKQPLVGAVRLRAEFSNLKGGLYIPPPRKPPLKHDKKRRKYYHSVLITGFGYEPVKERYYFEIKNSGGIRWGKKGIGKVCQSRSLPEGRKPIFKWISMPIVEETSC